MSLLKKKNALIFCSDFRLVKTGDHQVQAEKRDTLVPRFPFLLKHLFDAGSRDFAHHQRRQSGPILYYPVANPNWKQNHPKK